MITYKQRTLETNRFIQANIAAGGERARQARHALNLADVHYSYFSIDFEDARKRALAHYLRYCERIGYDPMAEIPTA